MEVKVPENKSSRERKFPGTFVLGSESSREWIVQVPIGWFAPWSELAWERKSLVLNYYWYKKYKDSECVDSTFEGSVAQVHLHIHTFLWWDLGHGGFNSCFLWPCM